MDNGVVLLLCPFGGPHKPWRMRFRAEEDCPAAAGSYATFMVAAAGSECSPDRRTDHLLCSSPPEHPLLWNGPGKRPTSSDTLVTDKSAATVVLVRIVYYIPQIRRSALAE